MLYLLMTIIPAMCTVSVIFHMGSLLMVLLSLEALLLSVMFFLVSTSMIIEMSVPVFSVLILSISACETSIGLSLLVVMSRSYGSDMMNLLSLSKC
uniref:NADH-ubiquinone oxidoreductase chain 4L n=1 Tax=Whitmania acranulata TaxID=1329092 RepID=A0A0F6PBN4_WHICA|nr:NADH dehydrogenase subunit 4L [Whitmania acranulata]WDA96204.1 NADH dehydrogenase subunit 4L [Whitmania acranulata]